MRSIAAITSAASRLSSTNKMRTGRADIYSNSCGILLSGGAASRGSCTVNRGTQKQTYLDGVESRAGLTEISAVSLLIFIG
jgi:hypothetical protein